MRKLKALVGVFNKEKLLVGATVSIFISKLENPSTDTVDSDCVLLYCMTTNLDWTVQRGEVSWLLGC